MSTSPLSHRKAVAGMLLVTLLWSSAGVVTRHLEAARSFEVTFWRSLFSGMTLAAYFRFANKRSTLRLVTAGGKPLWISGLMWSVMFTCFMVAITLTTVANVLITMSVSPLLTALLARYMLGHRIEAHTWATIAVVGGGIAWMYGSSFSSDGTHLIGTLVAFGVPLAAAVNWNLLQRSGTSADLLPALLIGAVISCAFTLPLSLPLRASAHDIALLAALGAFQLAIPCILAVTVSRALPAPEISLLALLEIIFGIAWAWWGTNERPAPQVLAGGTLVLAMLAFNEARAIRRRP